jgi:hypothetical protein
MGFKREDKPLEQSVEEAFLLAKQSASSGFKLTTQAIILAAVAWAIIAALFFLLFSVPLPGQGRPEWYGITTYLLENIAFLGAGLLCFRNWRSPQIVSGRTVWLAIGLGMFSFFIGNLLLAYWEIGLGKDPDISPGDFFFIATYLFLGWGMLLAVISRQLNLNPLQWLLLAGIAVLGIAIAYFINAAPVPEDAMIDEVPVPTEQVIEASPDTAAPGAVDPATAPDLAGEAAPGDTAAETPEDSTVPAWAIAIDNALAPFANVAAWLYIVGDILLVVMASALLLAFWGGRFSLSWRFIAAGAFSFYIADMWFNYAITFIEDYQTGALPEVFWIFSACLFAIGAALEYDLSTRSRRSRRRTA